MPPKKGKKKMVVVNNMEANLVNNFADKIGMQKRVDTGTSEDGYGQEDASLNQSQISQDDTLSQKGDDQSVKSGSTSNRGANDKKDSARDSNKNV
jgi:hypothetical protein